MDHDNGYFTNAENLEYNALYKVRLMMEILINQEQSDADLIGTEKGWLTAAVQWATTSAAICQICGICEHVISHFVNYDKHKQYMNILLWHISVIKILIFWKLNKQQFYSCIQYIRCGKQI